MNEYIYIYTYNISNQDFLSVYFLFIKRQCEICSNDYHSGVFIVYTNVFGSDIYAYNIVMVYGDDNSGTIVYII